MADESMEEILRDFLEQWEASCHREERNALRDKLLRLLNAGQAMFDDDSEHNSSVPFDECPRCQIAHEWDAAKEAIRSGK